MAVFEDLHRKGRDGQDALGVDDLYQENLDNIREKKGKKKPKVIEPEKKKEAVETLSSASSDYNAHNIKTQKQAAGKMLDNIRFEAINSKHILEYKFLKQLEEDKKEKQEIEEQIAKQGRASSLSDQLKTGIEEIDNAINTKVADDQVVARKDIIITNLKSNIGESIKSQMLDIKKNKKLDAIEAFRNQMKIEAFENDPDAKCPTCGRYRSDRGSRCSSDQTMALLQMDDSKGSINENFGGRGGHYGGH